MIIYKGYYIFVKHNGLIRKSKMNNPFHGCTGISDSDLYGILICVRTQDPLETQVKSVLHELAHLGLEFQQMQKEDVSTMYQRQEAEYNGTSEVGRRINEEVEKFYKRDPPLVDEIRRWLNPSYDRKKPSSPQEYKYQLQLIFS